jgi:hypothetical protein
MENVRTTFRKLRSEQRKAEKLLKNYENRLAKSVEQPGLTDDSLVSELRGLVRRRTQLDTVLQRTGTETVRSGFFRRFFGPPQKEEIDALKQKIENFSTRLHEISTTLKLNIPNAVIKANIEAPLQSRYLDLLNQQTEAEEPHQGSGWTQQALNGEIREIADRRWQVERLSEEIRSSAANRFELFLQPNQQDLTNLEQRLTGFDRTVSEAAERNRLDLNAAWAIARGDDLLRQQERTLTEEVRAGQSRREEPVAAMDVTGEIQEIRRLLQQARQISETLRNGRGDEGAHPQAMQTRVECLIQEINRHRISIEGLNRGAARINRQAGGVVERWSNEATLPAYTLPPGYQTVEVGQSNQPASPIPAGAEKPAAVVFAQARRSASPESTHLSIRP